MKRFVWRLQRVLEIKANEERIKKTELLKLTEKLTQKRSELLIRERILNEMIHRLAEMQPQKRLIEQELFLRYSSTADELIRQLKMQITQLETEQSKKIAEVLKLRRFREGMEKLREQAKMEFIREQEKLEQKELDETAAIRFARETNPALQGNSLNGKAGPILSI